VNKSGNIFSLEGKKGLVIGIANDASIAYGCAKAFHAQGAELAVTYLNEKAKQYVEPLAKNVEATIFEPLNYLKDGELEAVFEKVKAKWGKIDFILHSVAFAPLEDLHGRVIDCSKDGFLQAADISCHSFIRTAKVFEPIMNENGTILTVTFYGSEKVVENYNMMGPIKALLESSAMYVAAELGPKGISVNAISPGPLSTRAASGLKMFDKMMQEASDKAPQHCLVNIDEIGGLAAYLVSDKASAVTGDTIFVDAGYHIMH